MASERLTIRALGRSVGIGPRDPMRLDLAGLLGFLAIGEKTLRFRPAEERAILRGGGFVAPPPFLLARLAQIDDLAQRVRPGYFLRKASIDTTFASFAGSACFAPDSRARAAAPG